MDYYTGSRLFVDPIAVVVAGSRSQIAVGRAARTVVVGSSGLADSIAVVEIGIAVVDSSFEVEEVANSSLAAEASMPDTALIDALERMFGI